MLLIASSILGAHEVQGIPEIETLLRPGLINFLFQIFLRVFGESDQTSLGAEIIGAALILELKLPFFLVYFHTTNRINSHFYPSSK